MAEERLDSNSDEDEVEIVDVEEYRGSDKKGENFSHQQLVMDCFKRCIDAGSKEMVEGRVQTKKDKFGNNMVSYLPDTRKVRIEAIGTAVDIMACDFDDTAEKIIDKLEAEVEERKEFWINHEHEWFNSLPWNLQQQKIRNGEGIYDHAFNVKHPFINFFISEELEIHKKMFRELNHLTKRLDFYEGVMLTG